MNVVVLVSLCATCWFAEVFSAHDITATLESKRVTPWGDWHDWEYCPEGMVAQGFQLRVESNQGGGDDSALNGVRLFCVKPGEKQNKDKSISSHEGHWGTWRATQFCNRGAIKGFAMRTEESCGPNCDDTAANDMSVTCSGGEKLEGGGMPFGTWSSDRTCPTGSAVCAIRTQIEAPKGNNWLTEKGATDDTALNNVDLKCCSLRVDVTCKPSDQWVTVLTCANTKGIPIKCSYTKKEGVTRGTRDESGGGWSKEDYAKLGAEVGAEFKGLSAKFSAEVGTSKTTSHNWSKASYNDFSEETTTKAESGEVKPGQTLTLQQVVGNCGQYSVRTAHYRSV